MREAELRSELMRERAKFDKLVAVRERVIRKKGAGWFDMMSIEDEKRYARHGLKIQKLESRCNRIRAKLRNINPEEYSFGIRREDTGTYSVYGDTGFYVCLQCGYMFKHEDSIFKQKRLHWEANMSCCEEHGGMTRAGRMTLEEVVLVDGI